jgi:hypothetical protein
VKFGFDGLLGDEVVHDHSTALSDAVRPSDGLEHGRPGVSGISYQRVDEDDVGGLLDNFVSNKL